MKTIESHVNHLFRDVPQSRQTESIKEEIIENLEEKVQDLITAGKKEEDAINKAIVDFGDIDEIKAEFPPQPNHIHPSSATNLRLNLWYSLWGSALVIGLFLFINIYYTPDTIWFVYPTFAILWWPLSMFFYWRRKKGNA